MEAELLARVKAAAAEREMSVSTWFTQAAEAQIRQIYLQLAIEADEKEFGPMSEEEVARIIAESRKTSIIVNGNQIIRSDQGVA